MSVAMMLFGMGTAQAAPPQERLQIGALFAHGQFPGAYLTALGGELAAALEFTPNGVEIQFRVGLGEQACRLWLLSGPDPAASAQGPLGATASLEACLVQDQVDAHALDRWLRGTNAIDPTLRFQLQADPKQLDRWFNAAAINAALFVRACDANAARHRFYATLTIPPGALVVDRAVNQIGIERLRLVGTTLILGSADGGTWQDVVRGCGNAHVALPIEAAPGLSTMAVGRSDRVVTAAVPGYQSLEEARRAIEDLVSNDVMDRLSALQLVRPIDRVEEALRLARAGQAIKGVDLIVRRSEEAVPPEAIQAVAKPLAAAGAFLAISIFGDSQVLPPAGCAQPAPCVPVVLYANRKRAHPAPDGTEARPFRTIREALDAAAANGHCAVVVVAAAGLYEEELAITRHTRIQGPSSGRVRIAGSITQTGPYELTLSSVELWRPPGTALSVSNPCAVTSLSDVAITGATGYGLIHEGGTLTAAALVVAGTRATSDGRGGRAVVLAGGTQAALSGAYLLDNDGQGLLADGAGTRVLLRGSEASNNRAAPAFHATPTETEYFNQAALVARDGAILLAEWTVILDNEIGGLFVSSDARAHFRLGAIDGSRSVSGPTATMAGTNVLTHQKGVADLRTFSSSNASACGLQVGPGSAMWAIDGEVTRNALGACIVEPAFQIRCLMNDVRFAENGMNLSAPTLLLPDLFDDVDSDPASSAPESLGCVTVPFDCEWCEASP